MTDAATEPKWYCLRSQPKHEAIAAAHLRRLAGVEVFCPRLRFQRPRRARAGYADPSRVWATEAMFPGYLFAKFSLHPRHREIQSTSGVRGIVRFGTEFAPVPAGVIEALRASVSAEAGGSGSDDPTATTIVLPPEPQPGQEIMLVGGAFDGLRTVVTRYLPARQRVCVLLEFLGRQMETEVTVEQVLGSIVHPLRRDAAHADPAA
ncbi:MAG: transcriptional activator RfaH [Verrucomicrobia bacterium]|nr:transcriptional activator RfaH [Verrucomicrobiota bacterium]MBV9658030.1 transcriptional activator RfaH [Verrucomicrobiota bacterium]